MDGERRSRFGGAWHRRQSCGCLLLPAGDHALDSIKSNGDSKGCATKVVGGLLENL